MSRTPLLAGNWKMHNTLREAVNLVQSLWEGIKEVMDREVAVCPPFTALAIVQKALEDTRIKLGAQDLYWEEKGAFTGEISPLMLKDVGCHYVIIGHSERRKHFKETDAEVNKKVKAALKYGLTPILCLGESLEQRQAGQAQEVVKTQIIADLAELTASEAEKIVIAYEPIWAIGTGMNDTPESSNEIIGFLRSVMTELFNFNTAQKIRILYGGSVKPDNIDAYMAAPEIDGALVGGASLTAESFARIVKYQG
jgi:triosephosphate isomerase